MSISRAKGLKRLRLSSKIRLGFPTVNLVFRYRERGQTFSVLNMLNKGID